MRFACFAQTSVTAELEIPAGFVRVTPWRIDHTVAPTSTWSSHWYPALEPCWVCEVVNVRAASAPAPVEDAPWCTRAWRRFWTIMLRFEQ